MTDWKIGVEDSARIVDVVCGDLSFSKDGRQVSFILGVDRLIEAAVRLGIVVPSSEYAWADRPAIDTSRLAEGSDEPGTLTEGEQFFDIQGVIGNLPATATADGVLDQFIEWVESCGWEFCGQIGPKGTP